MSTKYFAHIANYSHSTYTLCGKQREFVSSDIPARLSMCSCPTCTQYDMSEVLEDVECQDCILLFTITQVK